MKKALILMVLLAGLVGARRSGESAAQAAIVIASNALMDALSERLLAKR